MGQNENEEKPAKGSEKAVKTSWFAGLKDEFSKITWEDKGSVARQTVAVIIITVVLALIIALVDWLVQYGVNFLVGLSV
ncbi:MAG: preprotein translocase subunit SecE [Clostridiales bacterium]|nr:preprotein translocase subunit SecE [Clostridiales bacterium]